MQYVRLGNTGLKVSRLCLGCMSFGDPSRGWHPWILDEEASRPILRRAVEAGINFFDTANIYAAGASEEVTGRALRDFARRDELLKDCQRIIARDAVNGYLYQLAKIGVWKKELVGMWENSPIPATDLTGVSWK